MAPKRHLYSITKTLTASCAIATLIITPLSAAAHATPSQASPGVTSAVRWTGDRPNTSGSDYYLDFENGNDANSGTTPKTAWKNLTKANSTTFNAGDRILLKSGSTWHGQQLWPKGSGNDNAPIIIGAYGDSESRPHIATDGNVPSPFMGRETERDAIKNPSLVGSTGAIVLRNQHHWEIYDLEISNDDDFDVDIVEPDGSAFDGVSISINADTMNDDDPHGDTVMRHFRVANLYIHNIDGPNTWQKLYRGGVNFQIFGSKQYEEYPEHSHYFQDVRIENNYIDNVELNGIQFGFNWWGDALGQYDESGKFHEGWEQLWVRTRDLYSRDIYIGHNYLSNIGQGGIQLANTKDMLVEYNEINGFLRRYNQVSCGLYLWAGADSIMQYNEVYDGPYDEFDGTPWDLEYTNFNVTYQYNYSHDNKAGWMSYMGNSDNSVARYNLSINDNGVLIKNMLSTNYSPTYFTNNVFVYDASEMDWVHDEVFKSTVYFMNNVFYNVSPVRTTPWYRRDGALKNAVFSNNSFFEAGGVQSPTRPTDAHAVLTNPLFKVEPQTSSAPRLGVENITEVADRFTPMSGSPLIDGGRYNAHLGAKDFIGTSVFWGDAPDIGIIEVKQGAEIVDPEDTDPIESEGHGKVDLARDRHVVSSSTHPQAQQHNLWPGNLVDGKSDTRWAAEDEPEYPINIDIDFDAEVTVSEVVLEEFLDHQTPARIGQFSLYAWNIADADWEPLPFFSNDEGIGAERTIAEFTPMTTKQLRFAIDGKLPEQPWGPTMTAIRVYGETSQSQGTPKLSETVGLFDMAESMREHPNNQVAVPVVLNGGTVTTLRTTGSEGNVLGSLPASEYEVISDPRSKTETYLIKPSYFLKHGTGETAIYFEYSNGRGEMLLIGVVNSTALESLLAEAKSVPDDESTMFTDLKNAIAIAEKELAKANRDVTAIGNNSTSQHQLTSAFLTLQEALDAFGVGEEAEGEDGEGASGGEEAGANGGGTSSNLGTLVDTGVHLPLILFLGVASAAGIGITLSKRRLQ